MRRCVSSPRKIPIPTKLLGDRYTRRIIVSKRVPSFSIVSSMEDMKFFLGQGGNMCACYLTTCYPPTPPPTTRGPGASLGMIGDDRTIKITVFISSPSFGFIMAILLRY